MQRLTRRERDIDALEQQASTTHQRQPPPLEQQAQPCSSKLVHRLVAQSEMMARFMDQDVADEMFELLAILDPFVEDRAAKQADPVG